MISQLTPVLFYFISTVTLLTPNIVFTVMCFEKIAVFDLERSILLITLESFIDERAEGGGCPSRRSLYVLRGPGGINHKF